MTLGPSGPNSQRQSQKCDARSWLLINSPKIHSKGAPDSVENVFLGPPLCSVELSAGYLLTTMCRSTLRSLTDSENGPLMAPVDWGRAKEAKEAQEVKESRPLALIPLAIATLLAILGSAAHGPTLLITPGYLVRAGGCPCTCAVPPSKTSASTPPNFGHWH